MEGLGARAVLNYVLYEFEVGGPSREVVEEALRIAQRELDELQKVVKILQELKVYV
ncbi:hypothetical protein TUZN_0484 [Thermoproteus uzoniensis 768-20]|uniref:Uncharacterized protein n=1 Tax=Thermoproteus uzoniensis (strain 768-20) TaxID=999630 RepID=F2L3C1_THEU7|nr:hypothetical protein TUZN_0484 [Thermoproteus uzoniensis 768-20]